MDYKKKKNKDNKINWWELSLIGIGSIIGAGFFLGSEITIRLAGTGALIVYIFSGITAYIVFTALAEMSINDPEEGSFKSYAYTAYGHQMAFVSGWIYWIAGVLVMSSAVIALSVFTQYWFNTVPIWILALIYSILSFSIVLLGVDDFAKTESIFAVIKIAVLVIFILFGLLILLEIIDFTENGTMRNIHWFSQGLKGIWHGMIYGLLPFCGVATIGILATDLDYPQDILKSGRVILFSLMLLYTLPLYLILNFVPVESIQQNQSPFLTLLLQYNLPWVDSIFNIILILATFSTLVGTIYCIAKMMHSMAVDGDAPKLFIKTNHKAIPTNALMLSAVGSVLAIFFSSILPKTIFEHFIGSASIMLVLNWMIILLSQRKIRKNKKNLDKYAYTMPFFPWLNSMGMALVAISLLGTLFNGAHRISSILTMMITLLLFLIACKKNKHHT
ncbi:MAG: amino acid permease [Eubacteriales bacterium]